MEALPNLEQNLAKAIQADVEGKQAPATDATGDES
jgi:hypothetical protein